jgi:type I restriction enzyme M protein
VLPKAKVKLLKDEKKQLNASIKTTKKQVKEMRKEADRLQTFGDQSESNIVRTDASDMEGEGLAHYERAQQIDTELARDTELETELKTLKSNIKEAEKKKDDLVEAARAKISEDEARDLILERLKRLLSQQYDGYLRHRQRELIAAVENLHNKYAVTVKQILTERDAQADQLNHFLVELGYE